VTRRRQKLSDSAESARFPHRARGRKSPLDELGAPADAAPDSLRATMVGFIDWCLVRHYSEVGLTCTARDLKSFASWCEERGLERPAQVTRPILERYQRQLYYHRKTNGQPLSVARQLTQLVHVKQYFRWLSRENFLLANPASELVLPKKSSTLPRYTLTVTEVEAVLAVPDVSTLMGLRARAIIEVLWATGLRRSELTRLLIWDVQFERGTVFVRLGKGRKDRVVPITQRALSWVRRYIDEVRPRYAVAPDAGFLFLSESGEPLLPEVLTEVVKALVTATGVKARGACHLFRHACATAMLEGGADIRFVQELLGHATIETTQVYTRVAISKLKAVYEATHPGAKSEAAAAASPAPASSAELLAALENEASRELDAGADEQGENG
jgi:integrase/recombinase XerD